MKLKDIKMRLNVDTISKKDNVITVRKSFYYKFDRSLEMYIDRIKKAFPKATIIDSGELYTAFRGSASIANQSHWYVKFII